MSPTGRTLLLTSPGPAPAVDLALEAAADALTIHGGHAGTALAMRMDRLREREAHVVWIVLIVAVAIVLAVGVLAYVAIYCINRGGNSSGGLSFSTNGWKVWEYRMRFSCTR